MTVPEIIQLASAQDTQPQTDSFAIFITSKGLDAEHPESRKIVELTGLTDLAETCEAIGFSGKKGEIAKVYAPQLKGKTLYLVGLGADLDDEALRTAGGELGRAATKSTRLNLLLENLSLTTAQIAVLVNAISIASYSFTNYLSESNPSLESITLIGGNQLSDTELVAMTSTIEAVALTKDLINTPAKDLGPEEFVDEVFKVVDGLPINVKVLNEEDLKTGGFGGILSVASGSIRPPRLVELSYEPKTYQEYIALVGKGITFDTGGLSLKPAASMVGMKYDMAGAATVLAVIRAVAQQKLPIKVSAWLCLAENMPSGSATRPGDVATIANGKTVEILNTDAEGRLVLADGLVAASRTNPDLLIDVATLTGAITVALGNRHVGVMGDDDAIARYLAAAKVAGEGAWQLPLPAYLKEQLKSPIADIVNAKIGDPAAGSLFAGVFLEQFITNEDGDVIPWIHLDIAGVGMNKSSPYGLNNKGPTAVPVRTLIELISEASDVEQ